MPPNPVDFRLANAPLTFVNDLARCAPELQNVVNVLDLRALHLERALLEDIRRKSNAQHRGSKHLDALTLARRLSRDVDALDTRETFVRLLRDVEACVKHARSLEGGETREAPARARARTRARRRRSGSRERSKSSRGRAKTSWRRSRDSWGGRISCRWRSRRARARRGYEASVTRRRARSRRRIIARCACEKFYPHRGRSGQGAGMGRIREECRHGSSGC